MIRPSPDARWTRPGFALRRLLGRPTVAAEAFAPDPDPARLDALGARLGRARPPGAPPRALLIGPMPRAGSNFVEALIAAHPAVAARPCGLRELPVLAELPRLAPFARAVAARHASADLPPEAWLGLILSGLWARAAAERPDAGLILFKDPHARRLDRLRAAAPDLRLIAVLRDGPHTVDSAARTWPARGLGRWLGRGFADLCREWALGTGAILDAAAADPRVILVRHEDAAADPVGTARGLWAALGLGPAPAQALAAAASAPVLGSSVHSRRDGRVDWTPRAAPPDFDPAGRALDWTARRHRIFAREAGAVAARLAAEAPAGRAVAPATPAAPGPVICVA